MKKSMVYSILTILLLGTIVLGAASLMQRTVSLDEVKSQGFISSKFLRLQSTIATDYIEMTGVDIEILSSESMELNHSISLSENEPLTHTLLKEYIYYIENHYASTLNLNISLDLKTDFRIMPMNYSIERTYTNYTAKLGEDVERIDIKGYMNEEEDYINETLTQFQNGSTHVTIQLYDYENKSNQLYEFNGSIDLTEENLFSIKFYCSGKNGKNDDDDEDEEEDNNGENGNNIDEQEEEFLEFILIAENNNVNIMSKNGLNSKIALNYGFNRDKSKIYLNTGTHINISTHDKSFEKTGEILLRPG